MTTTSHPTLTDATNRAARAAVELSGSTTAERATWLRTVAAAIDAESDELTAIANEETALGLPRLSGEVARTSGQLRMFAEVLQEGSYLEVVIDHANRETLPARPDLRRMLHPLGAVAVFAASNFPFAFGVAGGDSASALAAGCPVVAKVHPGHPRTAGVTGRIVQQALLDAGAPDGGFALVEGFSAGAALVSDPRIRAVSFTGSLRGGRALLDLVNTRPDPIPFYGELGSLNPAVLSNGAVAARPHELAAGLAGSFTLGVGQFCTKPGLVFVPEGAGFEDALAAEVGGAEAATMLYDGVAERFAAGLSSLASSHEVDVIIGDPRAAVHGRDATPVVLATSASALLGAPNDLLEECFGPSTLLVRYRDQQELLGTLEAMPGSLAAAVHAEPSEYASLAPVIEALTKLAGRVIHDGWPTGVAVSWSQHHGGPWPATTAPLHTSVGATAIRRFLRPVTYQDVPETWLPDALRDENPLGLPRRVDGHLEVP